MANNKLAHLVGDYQSDSDNDDTEHRKNILKSITTDWTQCTDATTGHPYYWNIETKDVTWEMPPEYQRFLEQAAFTNSQSFRKWILCYTDDNAPYYFNEITREISWERPDDFIESSELPTKSRSDSRQSNISDSACRAPSKTMLNLVPEYNSDESDDENSEKPLFPLSSNTLTTKNQITKSVEMSNKDIVEKSESQPTKKIEFLLKEPKPSFASIITGGRSPQHKTVDIKLYTGEDAVETSSKKDESPNETEILSQKTFQRKRRIELNVGGSTHAKRTSNHIDDETGSREQTRDTNSMISNLKNKYVNFQKGETEFVDKQPSKESVEPQSIPNETNDDIKEQQQLLEAKLNFLCGERAEVSPVQIIQIQLQALQAAHIAEALHSAYLLEWMRNISNDLIKLESDAAPDGWKCLWNREKAQYCYENTTTGEIRWEYPEEEVIGNTAQDETVIDDDAMDICTTPPPNEHEDLSAAYFQNADHQAVEAPPAPAWNIEATKDNKEKPIDDELASFYSDIAKLEPETTNEENSCENPDPSASPENTVSDGDDKKKKKKKKSKKLEPWRSGNLENWINKWQKAQKELDG